MTPLKERFSNVIVWFGFIFLMGGVLGLITTQYDGGPHREHFLVFILLGVLPWLGLSVANYLLSGRIRLLPWENP